MRPAAPHLLRHALAGGHLRSSFSCITLAGGGRGGLWVTLNGAVALVARDASVLDRSRVFVLDLAVRWPFFGPSEGSA